MYVKSCVYTFTSHVTQRLVMIHVHIFASTTVYTAHLYTLLYLKILPFFFLLSVTVDQENLLIHLKHLTFLPTILIRALKKNRGASKKLTSAC